MLTSLKFLLFYLLLFFGFHLYSQNTNRSIHVKYIHNGIELDGILDEKVWEEADSLDILPILYGRFLRPKLKFSMMI